MATSSSTYDRTQYRDRLFPEGRPECSNGDGQPMYLSGLCGACFAAKAAGDQVSTMPHMVEGRRRTMGGFINWVAEQPPTDDTAAALRLVRAYIEGGPAA